ncbi:hypothetical protein [Novosphingobium sp. Leaf2]|uniref:hypothetical protein n=1 Tax=Novosphingobium sp. Leaf2 TaxID=1735670 RepID=UPI0006FC1F72|nr:hypothetical protein [Novosphingobium sp. Leaf2]KQM21993.1 hypothetical protein ASE49_01395 [Novosphingobium sp. Leaf2]
MRIIYGLGITASWCILVAAVPSGAASAGNGWDQTWGAYRVELARRCPTKHLELLAPADLRDVLDTFKAKQPPHTRRLMDSAQHSACVHSIAGTTCDNAGDIRVAQSQRLLPRLVAAVCGSFTGCASQSDCTAKR